MLFNSYEFIFVFLPITFIIYFYLNKKRLVEASKGFLLVSSLFFYTWWNIIYLPLILGSMLFNYIIGVSLSKHEGRIKQKSLLTFGILGNLSLLGYFKYTDFFIENINVLTDSNIGLLNLALPLAISFFTFQQIAYLVDSYRNETKEYDFLNYAVFVTFFPQLLAGPIVHHKEMMPQFSAIKNKVINYKNVATGLFIFSIGLFKKIVIADSFAVWANNGFDMSKELNMLEAWITSLSYTFQLYFDFSGYTDMAIGIALLFNIKIPINFNSPYKSLNIQDFWRRWHITLSRFLKDYIYIPLGGNKKGNFKTYNNLMITFILGGIWHGAGWTFIFWGVLHGLALVTHRIWQDYGFKLNKIMAWFITFNFINIAWIFFRAKEWDDAIKVLSGMFDIDNILPMNFELKKFIFLDSELILIMPIFYNTVKIDIAIYIVSSLVGFYLLFCKNTSTFQNNFTPSKINVSITVLSLFMSLLFLSSIHKTEFLYFDF